MALTPSGAAAIIAPPPHAHPPDLADALPARRRASTRRRATGRAAPRCPYLKALTPPEHEVSFTDELMHDLDVDGIEREADVVGLTAMGPQIRRAYDLADHFRARGKRVVLGGTWVTLTPEESLRHADAVVAGEAEYVWPQRARRSRGGPRRGASIAPTAGTICAGLPAIDPWTLPLLEGRRLPARAGSTACTSSGRSSSRAAARIPASTARCRRTTSAPSARARSTSSSPTSQRMTALGARRFLFMDDNPVRPPRGGEGDAARPGPAPHPVGEPGDHQRGARPRAARSGGALRRARALDRLREPVRGEPRVGLEAVQPPEPLQGGHRQAARARHPGDRAPDGRTRRRHARDLPRHAALARREQDQLPEAVHAGALSRHEVPRRHGRPPAGC